MTFDSEKNTIGRKPCTIVEIDFDRCALVYGSSPCTAGGGSGDECYNTFGSCQDTDNYDNSDVLTVRFSSKDSPAIIGQNVYPCLEKVTIAPTKLNPGKGLSSRSKVDIVLADFTDSDLFVDPYAATRNYIATDSGTFFGKLFARNIHYLGREIRVKMGFFPSDGSVADLTDFDKTHTYIIDRVDGVNGGGKLKIVGKDILSLADGLKAQVPQANAGTLAAAITGTPSTFTVNSGDGAEYSASGYVRISDEIIQFTRASDTFTVVARGAWGTTTANQTIDSSVQECVSYSSIRVDAVVEDLLTTHVGIDAAYIPSVDWDAEADEWLNDYNLTNIISEPTAVAVLLNQICVECGVDLWWSDETEEIRLKAQVPEQSAVTAEYNDDVMIKDRATLNDEMTSRLSQVYFYWGIKDFSGDRDEVGNFDGVVVRADAESEGADEYNQKGIKKVYCNWLDTSTQAGQQASRLLARYKNPPRRLRCEVDISQDDIKPGDHLILNSALLQNFDGTPKEVEMQLLSAQIDERKQVIKAEALTFRFSSDRFARIAPTGTPDYLSASVSEQLNYSFICSTTGIEMSNGDEPYLII